MSEVSFYDITIPIFSKRVQQLKHCLEKGEQWANENKIATSALVKSRLIEDMQPLPFQVQTVYRMVIYFFSRMDIPGAPAPTDIPVVDTYDGMFKQVDEIQQLLSTVKPSQLEGKASQSVSFGPPGRDPWKFTGLSFVQEFIMVNVYFHTTTAYDILRKEGVPLGKLDYLGKVGL
ncbi:hypothetical protein PRZ48_002858 [Zasmidium cellare]|uniref:DUF1993 domain-containing protein n=1 Tax=Zasmidium cellare TaxID=395010 RepID=A0ABR0EUF0_ZASCE|nr:hypothetical protein PRZ48_002858 [Zasmidium cellare]